MKIKGSIGDQGTKITKKNPDVSIIAPFYDESESVNSFFDSLLPVLGKCGCSFEILCINDGSSDNTLEQLLEKKQLIPSIRIVDFSRNFGKEAAITAGIDFSRGDCVIPMDCDLQDPPELIPEMIKKWRDGAEVVLAKRSDRSGDKFLKRLTARWFYRVYNWLADVKLPENVGDYRLMDRKVVEVLKKFRERKRFMKGLFAFVGFKTSIVEYRRQQRNRGESKWSYWKLWNFAVDGITSFSTFPLKLCTYLGSFVTILAFGRGLWILFHALLYGVELPGYASMMTAILFMGGVQLISLGLIGEYIGRIYTESKQRPIYIVKNIVD